MANINLTRKSDAYIRDMLAALVQMNGHEHNAEAIRTEMARRAARRAA